MQKVLIAQDLKPLLMLGESFIDRADIATFTAATNDELLKIHIEENVNLIITKRDLPGAGLESIFDIIRRGKQLKEVLVIMACEDNVALREHCRECGANAVLSMPVEPALLHEKVRQFLAVEPRQSYRVLLNVAVEGKFRNQTFLCHMDNMSVTGMRIRTVLDLAVGEGLSCSFYLPDGTRVGAHGKVVRSIAQPAGAKEKLYGIRFTDLAADVKTAIREFIQKELRYKLASSGFPGPVLPSEALLTGDRGKFDKMDYD